MLMYDHKIIQQLKCTSDGDESIYPLINIKKRSHYDGKQTFPERIGLYFNFSEIFDEQWNVKFSLYPVNIRESMFDEQVFVTQVYA